MVIKIFGGTRKSLQLLLILCVMLLVCTNTCVVGLNSSSAGVDIKCIERERHALLMIKKDLVDEFGHHSSWGDEECCNWRGIRCNNQTRHVTMLDLHVTTFDVSRLGDKSLKPLRGKISSSLFELQHLTHLDLSCNDFQWSRIPHLIGSLTQLRYLNLSYAEFGGTIPFQLGNLSSLESLDLKCYWLPYPIRIPQSLLSEVVTTQLSLSSDNLNWLGNLPSLRYLDMSEVKLEKAVDWIQAISMLPSIVELRLSGCSLSSTIPPHLSLLNSSTSLSVLDLSLNTLTPKLYHWLFNFVGHSLVYLDLSWNFLEGPIPDAFENMTSLAHLHLSSNQLEGGIPKFLGNLLHIRTLRMFRNNLNGSLHEIFLNLSGHATNTLEILDLGSNQLQGTLTEAHFLNLTRLRLLDLSFNQFNGSLPESIGQLSKLEHLRVSSNQLQGTLTEAHLLNLTRLRLLDLSFNQFNGSLPESIGQLSKLERLDVSYNQLQGTLTEAHFLNLTRLEYLDFSKTNLILDFPSKWLPPFQLVILGLHSCKVSPSFPVWLRTQKNISNLDLSNSGILDSIPNWFWDVRYNLERLNLSHNHIKGILPDFSSYFVCHPIIDLSSNNLEVPLPLFPSNSIFLNLSNNMLNGPISVICASNCSLLNYLDLSNNWLSGHLPDCWWQYKELKVLRLDNNHFDGKIPSSMGSLLSIQSLHLSNNNLIGELPSSLQNCTKLVTMDVGENQLTVNVPAWIGEKLLKLTILRLRSNEFYGSIPLQLCYLMSVQILDIAFNGITGTIPECFNNFTAIAQNWTLSGTIGFGSVPYSMNDGIVTLGPQVVDNALVAWKGGIQEYRNTLGLVKIIDLSSNKLMGEIPLGITNLSGLMSLNLSRNNLVGLIPHKIGQLRSLESLDLSRNRLYGEIPGSMSDLNFLNHLDLSYNNLSGKIPSGTQLQSLEASLFAGNPALCGPPTTQKCPGDYTKQAPPTTGDGDDANTEEHDDELARDKWFYASIAVGFIVGFWGVCGTLLLHRSWRHAYFQFFDNTKDWIYVTIAVHTTRMRKKFQSCRNNWSQ